MIEQHLLKNRITADKTIILYSDNQLAACHVFWALKRVRMKDVRVLNSNISTWMEADFPSETTINMSATKIVLGTKIPANSAIDIVLPKKLSLLSNRA